MYKKKNVRKEYSKEGSTQTMVSFRCDNDLLGWLKSQTNKGRVINNLIRRAMVGGTIWVDPDADPDENRIEDTMP